jgi:hypothetical protein
MKDVKARKDRGIADLQPFVVPRTGILPREDEFAEGKEAEFDRVHTIGGGTSDVPEQLIGQEGDLGPDMRQPPVRRDENGRLVAVRYRSTPRILMLTRYLRNWSRRSSGMGRFSRC